MSRKQTILRGTFILTAAGILSRIMGFFYRIFLSRTFGAEGVGLYQLIFPIYTLCFSITTAGIETAISRTVARKTSLQQKKESLEFLFTGILCSLVLSVFCVFILKGNALFIARHLLGDIRCEPLLNLMAYTIPFSAIHSCITGYYYGRKLSETPALCQLIEQTTRMAVIFFLYHFYVRKGLDFPIIIAVFGLVTGEAVSALYCIFTLKHTCRKYKFQVAHCFSHINFKELLALSLPLTANRILVNLLQSIEAISIPGQLQKFSLSSSDALSLYGVLNGMALPCILFPSAVTNSVSVMLMPTVAEIQACGKRSELLTIIKKVCGICFLLGLCCCFLFLLFGTWIGTVLFHSETAGNFIITLAWICPFLYTNSALLSVINGLGKTGTTLFINTLGLLVRIAGVFFAIPIFGIKGYLWGLLVSQLLVSVTAVGLIFQQISRFTPSVQ